MLKKIVVIWVCVLVSPAVITDSVNPITIGVTHGLERVGQYDPIPEAEEVNIALARNEYEPFQIVIHSDEPTNIDITIGLLYDGKGNTFSEKNFTLYRVHYLYVETPSPRSHTGPGWYPDGLSPLDPTTVANKGNTVVWVDVYAPEDQHPGLYTGSVYVEAGELYEILLTVEVWGFTLPKKTSLKSGVEVVVEYVLEAHDLSWDPEELDPVLYTYYETLIEHRVMPWELYFSEPEVYRDGSISMEENHQHLTYFMDTLQVNCLIYPLYEDWPFRDPFGRDLEKTTTYIQELHEYYTENGWEDRFFFYIIDEPNTKRAYEEVRDISRDLKSIHPDIKFLVTEQIVPDDPSWGDLLGYVDIWCPLFPCIEDEKEVIKERQALGEEVWTYTALTQGERETPFWELDFPVLNYRVVPWMVWKSQITGVVYWACNWWDVSDPWEDTGTWTEDGEVYNGEGVLVYPGEDGCVPSIRLKVLREGMEDYEYFTILNSLGKKSFTDGQVEKIVKSWYEWNKDPGRLLEVRRILGEEISSAVVQGSQGPLEESPAEEKGESAEKQEEQEQEHLVEKEEREEEPYNGKYAEKGEDLSESEQDTVMYVVIIGVVLGGSLALLLRKKS
jgi:hypothetical protein